MNDYRPGRKCAKCGHVVIATHYVARRGYRLYSQNRLNYDERAPDCEYLKRRCERCRFEWAEACLGGSGGEGGEREV